jgi:tRNA dimethylallyltransferase
VKCLLQGLDDLPVADTALRERVEKMTLAELQAEAEKTAPEAYRALADNQNPRRLIRLLETTANHDAGAFNHWKNELPSVIGLHVERDVLHRRIAARVEAMYAGGLLEEARGLMDRELSPTAQHAIGYTEAFAVLRGEMSPLDAREKTMIRTRQLAKRQMTWFRHQLKVNWVNVADFPTVELLAEKVYTAWQTGGPVPLRGVTL